MSENIFRIDKASEYARASLDDLIQLKPVEECTSIILPKWQIEALFYAIVYGEFIHISGPTGAAKTSLIEALCLVPDNFKCLCKALGVPVKPLRLYPIDMVSFDTPGELLARRALSEGSTYDEDSLLVKALREAHAEREEAYTAIWLCEIGRVHSASIQGGLLNLMTRNDIHLPGGDRIPGSGIAWVADSNYQAENDSTHTLVTFDDALKRRFTVNLTLEYPSGSQEMLILKRLRSLGQIPEVGDDLVRKVVRLGQDIRERKSHGELQSVAPPTIYGYESFLRMAHTLGHLNLRQVAMATMLGNASPADTKGLTVLFSGVFALKSEDTDEASTGGAVL
jgi:MoxR-like ATPase